VGIEGGCRFRQVVDQDNDRSIKCTDIEAIEVSV
jgi:hypothetical protein